MEKTRKRPHSPDASVENAASLAGTSEDTHEKRQKLSRSSSTDNNDKKEEPSNTVHVASTSGENRPATQNTLKGFICSICLESTIGKKVKHLRCTHEFHLVCINEWLKCSKNCPVCREPVTPVNVRRPSNNQPLYRPPVNVRRPSNNQPLYRLPVNVRRRSNNQPPIRPHVNGRWPSNNQPPSGPHVNNRWTLNNHPPSGPPVNNRWLLNNHPPFGPPVNVRRPLNNQPPSTPPANATRPLNNLPPTRPPVNVRRPTNNQPYNFGPLPPVQQGQFLPQIPVVGQQIPGFHAQLQQLRELNRLFEENYQGVHRDIDELHGQIQGLHGPAQEHLQRGHREL